jgi:hypothetical protein
MNGWLLRTVDDRVVLAGPKATPFGWPPASLDPGSGRRDRAPSGGPGRDEIRQIRCLHGLRGLPRMLGATRTLRGYVAS